MTELFGVISGHNPEGAPSNTPDFIVPFHVVDVRKDPSFRPPGVCFMQVIFATDSPVAPLKIASGQELWFGGDVSVDAELDALLPFSTPPYHGFADLNTGSIVGDGVFFGSLNEAEAHAKGYSFGAEVVNLARKK